MLQEEGLAFSVGLRKVGTINFRTGVVDAGVGKRCFFVVKGQEPFSVALGVGDVAHEASKVCLEFPPSFEDSLPSRMETYFIGVRFVLKNP